MQPDRRRYRAGLVYVSLDGKVEVDVPLPIELTGRSPDTGRVWPMPATTPGPCPCVCNTLDQPCGGCGHAGCGRR
jgi:hypothetical protein